MKAKSYPASIEDLIERGERGEKLTRDELLLIVGAMDIAVDRWWAALEQQRRKSTTGKVLPWQ